MPISEMIIVWRVACGDAWADVHEDGRVVSDDAAFRDRLLAHLGEPVEVTRTGSGGVPMTLQPSDRRYVVARVRKLVAETPDLEIVDLYFTGEPDPAEGTPPA
ncbi:MAG TPA: hypothetical protein VG245_01500 [Candidatus Dormibacteraeota bacterium]|jgi:hypothetical protein|nr:hypothetical protein [Candidatus Dormibacteraeota bacterium]